MRGECSNHKFHSRGRAIAQHTVDLGSILGRDGSACTCKTKDSSTAKRSATGVSMTGPLRLPPKRIPNVTLENSRVGRRKQNKQT